MMKIGEVKRGRGRRVGLRVVASLLHQFYKKAEVCAVQVGYEAMKIRRGQV